MKVFFISVFFLFIALMGLAIGGSVYLHNLPPEETKEIISSVILETKSITQKPSPSPGNEYTGVGLFLDLVKLLLLVTLFAIVSAKLLNDWGIIGDNDEDK